MVWRHAIKVAVAAGEALVKGFSRAVREEMKGWRMFGFAFQDSICNHQDLGRHVATKEIE